MALGDAARDKIKKALESLSDLQQSFQDQLAETAEQTLSTANPAKDVENRLSHAAAAASEPWDVQIGPESLVMLVALIAFPVLVGYSIAQYTKRDVKVWSRTLKQPFWRPPAWIFGPVWTGLYTGMGLASWMVWTHGGCEKQKESLGLYAAQLFLNFVWQPIFFRGHSVGLALLDAIATLGVAAVTTFKFKEVDPAAAKLMYPYLVWLAHATILNFRIWTLNKSHTTEDGDQEVHHVRTRRMTGAKAKTPLVVEEAPAAGKKAM